MLAQRTEYPYDGKIRFTASQIKQDHPFTLRLRIPGWVKSGCIRYGEQNIPLTKKEAGTYVAIEIRSLQDFCVELMLDMPVRMTQAHPFVEECVGQVAVERGPLVYCMETPDVEASSLDQVLIDPAAEADVQMIEVEGRRIPALQMTARLHKPWTEELYQEYEEEEPEKVRIQMIPYFAWDNRGADGEMRIWTPVYHAGMEER